MSERTTVTVEKKLTAEDVVDQINPSVSRRLLIVLCFPLFFLLAAPYWWATTSIERLPLPKERIAAVEAQPDYPIRTQIWLTADEKAIPNPPGGVVPIDQKLAVVAKKVTDGVDSILSQQRREERGERDWDLVLGKKGQDAPLRVHIALDETAKPDFPLEPYIQTNYGHVDVPAGTLVIPLTSKQTSDGMLGTHLKIAAINGIHNLLPANLPTIPNRALAYKPNVTLSFVVLNEDASEGSYVDGWSVESAIRDHFRPTLEPLAPLFNFSIESQVLYHAPLTFEPTQQEDGSWNVDDEQIKVFVSEHWDLDSKSTNNPVLRFMLYVPSTKHRPITLPHNASDAFLVPQFGSLVILNPPPTLKDDASYHLTLDALDQPFSQFTRDFYKLLAIPPLPSKLHACPEAVPKGAKTRAERGVSEPLSPWQLDTVLRMRNLENAREARKTLGGIVRLFDKIEVMEIHAAVREKILGAVAKLEQLPRASKADGPLESALLSRDAVGLANEAFFDPSMMGLLYFPDQHKFAVYAPLFAPIGVSLVAGLLKELRAWKARKKAKKSEVTAKVTETVEVEKDVREVGAEKVE